MASKQHKIWWQSSYDRGLDILLYIWPEIRKKYEDAELHVTYGWDLFDKAAHNNEERMKWKNSVVTLMEQDGVVHHGRVGKSKLEKLRKQCGIWAYPTYFQEINCITALECQDSGVVPVTMTLGALNETVQAGIKIEGDIKDPKVLEKYLKSLLRMMGDKKLWEEERKKGRKFTKDYKWKNISKQWDKVIKTKVSEPLVTIYTPTIRDGFWNIMAHNISNQTYKNLEWVVVDDQKVDRSGIAEKYATKYGIRIRYMKGKPRKTERTYGLINANNTALDAANGELFVFLQDFVLMPEDGIEQLVDVYRHHPDCFIAPVDEYYLPYSQADVSNKEDWFNGDLNVKGRFLRKNIRVQNKGLRFTETVTDFEQNYGAVPTAILKDLGGYYEFFDEALGYDDTEIIYRAFKKGYKLIIDDGNIATCIDHWVTLGKVEGGVNRTRRLNDPRFDWMIRKIEKGELPLVRNQGVDDKIELLYEIPEDVSDDDCVSWVRENIDNIVKEWE